jgi:hypothetical protein
MVDLLFISSTIQRFNLAQKIRQSCQIPIEQRRM